MKNLARALFAVTALAALVPTSSAWADEKPAAKDDKATAKDDKPTAKKEEEGRQHFLRAVDFSRDGDFRAALIEFRRAYDLAPNYRVLYNIGQTALELQEYAQSLDAFERYLAEGGAEVPAARRTQVETEVKRLSTRVSSVTINVNLPDASILVDDVVIGTSPLDHPLRVGAGRHKFSASTADIAPVSRVLDLPGGETTTVDLELLPPQAGTERIVIQPPPQQAPPSKTPLWIGIGVTSAFAIGTAVVGVLALSAKESFEDALGKYPGDRNDLESKRSTLRTTAVVFDVLAAATIVSGGVTLVLGLTSRHSTPATTGLRTTTPGVFTF